MTINAKLISFDIEVTNICENACKFCPRDKITRPKGFINERLFKNIVSELVPYNPLITLSGMGDPLLHPQVFDFLSLIRQNGLKVSIVINPNSLDDDRIEKLIASKPNTIQVSFPTINRQVYNMLNLRYNFDDALSKTIKLIESARDKVCIKIVGIKTKLNLDEEKEFSLFWKELGVRSIFTQCHSRGGNLNDDTIVDRMTNPNANTCTIFQIHTFIDWQGNILACCHDLKGETMISHASEGIKNLLERKTEILNTSLRSKKPLFDLCLRCDERLRNLRLPDTKIDLSKKNCQSAKYLKAISRLNKIDM